MSAAVTALDRTGLDRRAVDHAPDRAGRDRGITAEAVAEAARSSLDPSSSQAQQ